MYHIHAGRTRPKLPAEVDWWDVVVDSYNDEIHLASELCMRLPRVRQARS